MVLTRVSGLALVKALASRNDTIVYAGARNPNAADQLNALAQQHPGRVHVVKLTSANVADNRTAVDFIRQTSGRLDVVIANAATGALEYDALDVPLDVMRETYEVSTRVVVHVT
jgi:NAD(P)-dependent dehydrogenase (short-subunit alcohol dehydrogenase family)